MSPPRDLILVAEDDEDIAKLVEWSLQECGFDVHWAPNGDAAVDDALRMRPDLILLDVMMPGRDGLAVCQALRHDPRTAWAPIIMLTAKAGVHDKLDGLDVGADDYMTKPFDTDELCARVRTMLRRSRDLRDVSPLTGLPGNRGIARRLNALIDGDIPFALIHADLDHFKRFNDRRGFARGDHVIVATGDLLCAVVNELGGEHGFVGHIGGDDFAAVVDPAVAVTVAEEVIKRFDEMAPGYAVDAGEGRPSVREPDRRAADDPAVMTISLGIATTERRRFGSAVVAASVASEMKEVAKREAGSSYAVDRREA